MPLTIGSLELASRFALAPMAGFTNLALRLAIRERGGLGLATTDMMNARSLIEGGKKTLDLAKTHPDDHPITGQIYGPVPEEVAAAAQWLQAHGYEAVDFNMGCPVKKIVRRGNGVALMLEPDRARTLVQAAVAAVDIPVTVKMRLGWDAEHITAPALARELEQIGVAAVTVHGRTRGQFYRGHVSLEGIRAVVDAVRGIPVLGNGNVRTIDDARRMFETTGCAGIAVGRGAMGDPFLFARLARWDATGDPGPEPTFEERLAAVERHFRLLVEHQGERQACHMIRKFARYHRKFLRLPRAAYREMSLVESAAEYHDRIAGLRELGRVASACAEPEHRG